MHISQKAFSAVEIIIVLAVVAIIGGVGWVFAKNYLQKPAATESVATQTTTQKSAEAPLLPDTVIAKIKDALAAKYSLQSLDTNNQPSAGQLSFRITKSAPLYQADGYKYYNDYDGGATLEASTGLSDVNAPVPSAGDMDVRQIVAKQFASFKLTKTSTRGAVSDGVNSVQDVYTGKGIICTVETPQNTTNITSASCGETSKYTAVAQKLKPIVTTMPDATAPGTAFDDVKIKVSPVQGYEQAQIGVHNVEGIGGHMALFYKTPNGTWAYWKGTQNTLECADFSSNDLRSAFRGEQCYDADGNTSTVQ